MADASQQVEKPVRSLLKVAWRVAVLIFWISLATMTVPKLYTMSQIKGWIPGAKVSTYHITQKAKEQGEYGDYYLISWTQDDIRRPGNHRTNIAQDQWAKSKIRDPVEVITVGSDPSPYVHNDIFVETGNFAFDLLLLVAEACGITLVIRAFLRARRKPT